MNTHDVGTVKTRRTFTLKASRIIKKTSVGTVTIMGCNLNEILFN